MTIAGAAGTAGGALAAPARSGAGHARCCGGGDGGIRGGGRRRHHDPPPRGGQDAGDLLGLGGADGRPPRPPRGWPARLANPVARLAQAPNPPGGRPPRPVPPSAELWVKLRAQDPGRRRDDAPHCPAAARTTPRITPGGATTAFNFPKATQGQRSIVRRYLPAAPCSRHSCYMSRLLPRERGCRLRGGVFIDDGKHRWVQGTVAGDDFPLIRVPTGTAIVCDDAPRFLDEDRPGRHVPGL